jgi:hypothetical protein
MEVPVIATKLAPTTTKHAVSGVEGFVWVREVSTRDVGPHPWPRHCRTHDVAPRRRESRCDGKPLIQVGLQQKAKCDSRVRGNDGTWMGCAETTTMLRET